MKTLKKLALPLVLTFAFLAALSLGLSASVSAQCENCDPDLCGRSGCYFLCGCDSQFCYYC